jgi:hypothetical protein
MATERISVLLPAELLEDLDRIARNRDRFISDAIRHEIGRRAHEALRDSLRTPHPDLATAAEEDLHEWNASLPDEDASSLVDLDSGTAVRWRPGEGWAEDEA